MKVFADDQSIANRVKKAHRRPDMTVICAVAKLISETSCKEGISNFDLMAAHFLHPMSGLQRLRELNAKYHDAGEEGYAYYFRKNRYYPSKYFKNFCWHFYKGQKGYLRGKL